MTKHFKAEIKQLKAELGQEKKEKIKLERKNDALELELQLKSKVVKHASCQTDSSDRWPENSLTMSPQICLTTKISSMANFDNLNNITTELTYQKTLAQNEISTNQSDAPNQNYNLTKPFISSTNPLKSVHQAFNC